MPADTANLDEAMECRAQDPYRALDIENRYIAANPDDSHGHFARHLTWMTLGDYNKALVDCEKSIHMLPKPGRYMCRGQVYRALGDHARALDDFNQAHDSNYEDWLTSFGPHLRADTLARLGRQEEALRDCDLIANDHWMPAHDGLPGGDKRQFIAEIKRRAAAALKR